MNKQELQKQVHGLPSTLLDKCVLVDKSAIFGLIEQLDEPQKVVIPRFVAEWIEIFKRLDNSLYFALFSVTTKDEIYHWLYKEDNYKYNQELFARAWLDGYEVEQEKLYTVEIPNPRIIGNEFTVLMRNGFKEIVMLREYGDGWKQQKAHQLTEAEIKQDFEWAWQWAEEVE